MNPHRHVGDQPQVTQVPQLESTLLKSSWRSAPESTSALAKKQVLQDAINVTVSKSTPSISHNRTCHGQHRLETEQRKSEKQSLMHQNSKLTNQPPIFKSKSLHNHFKTI
jgi:hypothetical protein